MVNEVLSHHIWTIDGTFSVVPKPYYQLITIGAISNNVILLSIYALLPSKNTADYNNLFDTLRLLIPNFSPQTVKIDFEIGLINA